MSNLRILHLSDTHLFGDGSLHYGTVDTEDHFRRALDHVADLSFDLVVCSGDVSEDGSVKSYERALRIIEPWAAQRGARVVFAMGNHDDRVSFRSTFGDGQPGVGAFPLLPARDIARPIVSTFASNGWRTIVLDTSVPGAGYGELGAEQLDALASELSIPAANGTIVVMHHPPVPARTDLMAALDLDSSDRERFWEIVQCSDVQLVLSGHYHTPIVEAVHGVMVVVAPGCANVASAVEDPKIEVAFDSFGGVVLEIDPDRARALPFIQPVSDSEVLRLDEDLVRKIAVAAGRANKN